MIDGSPTYLGDAILSVRLDQDFVDDPKFCAFSWEAIMLSIIALIILGQVLHTFPPALDR